MRPPPMRRGGRPVPPRPGPLSGNGRRAGPLPGRAGVGLEGEDAAVLSEDVGTSEELDVISESNNVIMFFIQFRL